MNRSEVYQLAHKLALAERAFDIAHADLQRCVDAGHDNPDRELLVAMRAVVVCDLSERLARLPFPWNFYGLWRLWRERR